MRDLVGPRFCVDDVNKQENLLLSPVIVSQSPGSYTIAGLSRIVKIFVWDYRKGSLASQ
jgi:hypothetical protein